jgi:hypothetical protein
MSPRVAVTLSCGDNGAFAAHVGPNPSRVEQNTSDAARRQINRSASHHHIYGRFGAAISNEAARRISAGLCESRARRRYRPRAAYLAPAMSQTILGNPRELFVVDDDVVPFGALPALA